MGKMHIQAPYHGQAHNTIFGVENGHLFNARYKSTTQTNAISDADCTDCHQHSQHPVTLHAQE
jgi:hypothetical protein